MGNKNATLTHRHSFWNSLFQWLLKLLVFFLIFYFFWILTISFLGVLPKLPNVLPSAHFIYALIPTVIISWIWYIKAYRRIKLSEPNGFRDRLALHYFGFDHNFHARSWVIAGLFFWLGACVALGQWFIAIVTAVISAIILVPKFPGLVQRGKKEKNNA